MAFVETRDLNMEATELRLGLPGTEESEKQTPAPTARSNKRALPDMNDDDQSGPCTDNSHLSDAKNETAPSSKAHIVGWPPIRSYRKNCFQAKKMESEPAGFYVKVSMDGAPYLRKIDLNIYKGYPELLKALEDMFKFTVGKYSEREGYNGSEHVPTYEDKDSDWMLVGDVPWEMFITSCKRLRIRSQRLGCAV